MRNIDIARAYIEDASAEGLFDEEDAKEVLENAKFVIDFVNDSLKKLI